MRVSGVLAPGKAYSLEVANMTPSRNSIPSCIFCGPRCEFGYGKCHCGCGGFTKICTMTSRRFGVKQGHPCRFKLGHQGRIRVPLENSLPFKIDGIYCRLIPLNHGQYTIVNAEDYEPLMFWKWRAQWDRLGKRYYAVRSKHVKGKTRTVWMHRQILGLGSDLALRGDHENGVTLDNRRKNLRIATVQQNMQNCRVPITNKSGFKGVSFHRASGRWTSQISVNGKKIYLGIFPTPELAYEEYCKAATIYHGKFARLT